MKLKKILLLLAIFAMVSCEKEPVFKKGTFSYYSNMMCGDYVLTDVDWRGLAVDLNGDGVGSGRLISELCGLNGYLEPDYIARVEETNIAIEDYYGPTLVVTFNVPYPDFRKDSEGAIYLNGTSTLPMSIRYEYFEKYGLFIPQGRFYNFCYDESLVFLNSIKDVLIEEFEDGIIKIMFECSMFYKSPKIEHKSRLYYTFQKK